MYTVLAFTQSYLIIAQTCANRSFHVLYSHNITNKSHNISASVTHWSLLFLSPTGHFRYQVVGQKEEKNESNYNITHQLPVAFTRIDHVIYSIHTPRQQALAAVKFTNLK